MACDLAELVGSAIALQLLFAIPLPWGVLLTAADSLLLLALQRFGVRRLEAVVIALVALVSMCFALELFLPYLRRVVDIPMPKQEDDIQGNVDTDGYQE